MEMVTVAYRILLPIFDSFQYSVIKVMEIVEIYCSIVFFLEISYWVGEVLELRKLQVIFIIIYNN